MLHFYFLKLELIAHDRSIDTGVHEWLFLTSCNNVLNLMFDFLFQCFQYPNYFRIVLTTPEEMIQLACKRINEFCKTHRESDAHNTSSV